MPFAYCAIKKRGFFKNDLQWQAATVKNYIFPILLSSLGCFIYILDSSNSSSIPFWTSRFGSSSRSNWIGFWTGNSNSKQEVVELINNYLISVKEMSVKATFFFMLVITTNIFWNDAEMLLKSFWTSHLAIMIWLAPIF